METEIRTLKQFETPGMERPRGFWRRVVRNMECCKGRSVAYELDTWNDRQLLYRAARAENAIVTVQLSNDGRILAYRLDI